MNNRTTNMMQGIEGRINDGLSVYIEDRQFPLLSKFAYDLYRRKYMDSNNVKFCIINTKDPAKSHRCNPLLPDQITSISEAYEIGKGIFLSLCKGLEWEDDSQREKLDGTDFIAACLWFLKIYKNGKYCTFPHLIEFICLGYDEMFPILGAYPELINIVNPFVLRKTPLEFLRCRVVHLQNKGMYWIMTGNDFSLDINNPNFPKILCWGNNRMIPSAELNIYRMLCEATMIRLFDTSKGRKTDIWNTVKSFLPFDKRNDISEFMRTADLYPMETSYMNELGFIYQGVEGVTDQMIEENYYQIEKDIKEIANAFADQC